jgi:hypothetical protein
MLPQYPCLRVKICSLFLLVAVALSAQAQAPKPESFSSADFHKWVGNLHGRVGKLYKTPERATAEKELLEAQTVLLQRLRDEKWTKDESITDFVITWTVYETPDLDKIRTIEFLHTIKCIDQILPFLEDRKDLQAYLYAEKGYLLSMGSKSNKPEALIAFQKSVEISIPLTQTSELRRFARSVRLANLLVASGSKDKAEDLFLQVLGFPWYQVDDPSIVIQLKQVYISAGYGIIELRRGNLKKLKSLYFVPSTHYALQPLLDEAIKEAQQAEAKSKKP